MNPEVPDSLPTPARALFLYRTVLYGVMRGKCVFYAKRLEVVPEEGEAF